MTVKQAGKKGGKSRAANMTAEHRAESGRKAATARWDKRRKAIAMTAAAARCANREVGEISVPAPPRKKKGVKP